MSQHGAPDRPPAPDPPAEAPAWPCPLLPFLAAASVWLAAVHVVSRAQAMEVLLRRREHAAGGRAHLVWPAIYTSTLRRQFRLVLFRSKGWLYALLSRRLLASLFWTVWALAISFVLLLRFHVFGRVEWAVLAATIPMFALVFAALHRAFAKELRPDAAVTEALVWSRRACPALMLLLYVGALALGSDLPRHASLDGGHRGPPRRRGRLERERAGARGAALGRVLRRPRSLRAGPPGQRPTSLWALLATGAGNLAIFYHVCLALSCFRIPRAGFVQARLAPRSFENVFAAAAVGTFLVGFVYFPLLARLDEYVARFAGSGAGPGAAWSARRPRRRGRCSSASTTATTGRGRWRRSRAPAPRPSARSVRPPNGSGARWTLRSSGSRTRPSRSTSIGTTACRPSTAASA